MDADGEALRAWLVWRECRARRGLVNPRLWVELAGGAAPEGRPEARVALAEEVFQHLRLRQERGREVAGLAQAATLEVVHAAAQRSRAGDRLQAQGAGAKVQEVLQIILKIQDLGAFQRGGVQVRVGAEGQLGQRGVAKDKARADAAEGGLQGQRGGVQLQAEGLGDVALPGERVGALGGRQHHHPEVSGEVGVEEAVLGLEEVVAGGAALELEAAREDRVALVRQEAGLEAVIEQRRLRVGAGGAGDPLWEDAAHGDHSRCWTRAGGVVDKNPAWVWRHPDASGGRGAAQKVWRARS
jgi:hypothetical protein